MGDTIVAIATAQAPAAIGVVRLSGKEALAIALSFWQGAKPHPRTATLGMLLDGQTPLDQALITYFPAPHSYTGEDVVEISCHGSPYILRRVVEICLERGARLARPGEFSLRAYLHRKLSLDQAEAIADLIQARSAAAHRLALSQFRGAYYQKVRALREKLIEFLALMELEMDFSEEDVELASRSQLLLLLEALDGEVTALLKAYRIGQAVREGVPVAIVGRPNAGKSTLLNALLAEERAIVSDTPGTTRDTLEERLYLGGYELRLIDTAGLRENPADAIEAEGIRRARQKLAQAFLILYVFDVSEETPTQAQQHAPLLLGTDFTASILWIANKIDKLSTPIPSTDGVIFISAAQGTGMDALEKAIVESLAQQGASSDILLSHARHYESFIKAQTAVKGALQLLREGGGSELIVEELRAAQRAIGEITGEITPDEILGHIFSKFCIGK
ncbi:MAG: tRNA uridine-5-carboxymethylaminomethyl(34) synthesis GTPase MnmE [Bacteroidia bacterium]|nr:tRNA uridine-5-carboxymethylaminomethyl(34) synthesis GTPase MnmE [Bacteroidia bacterium]MDW8235320.1 tRNA uridine-5-carboxymethylaminomethyl(34) synthesis GTPase MnmE [Bacteroidia bacterium]